MKKYNVYYEGKLVTAINCDKVDFYETDGRILFLKDSGDNNFITVAWFPLDYGFASSADEENKDKQ